MSLERQFPVWDKLYEESSGESLPWYYAELDPDLERALQALGLQSGRALDLGTGPGSQAIAFAARGFDATGTDISPVAIARARERAADKGQKVRFLQDDVLDSRLEGPFELVLDRGCFHVMLPEQRPTYVEAVRRLVAPGGFLFLKCFSVKQPGDSGPFRFTPAEVEQIFAGAFAVRSIEETVYQGQLESLPLALFCVLQRA
jgi:cyclopropane fatty-acyl-phospholipid synthase-like methyltransferase